MQDLVMAHCPKCEGFMESMDFNQPREYLEMARQLIEELNHGTFVMVHATCPLQDLFNPQWPGNVAEHGFQCRSCGRTYQLFADTFHGRASWDLVV